MKTRLLTTKIKSQSKMQIIPRKMFDSKKLADELARHNDGWRGWLRAILEEATASTAANSGGAGPQGPETQNIFDSLPPKSKGTEIGSGSTGRVGGFTGRGHSRDHL